MRSLSEGGACGPHGFSRGLTVRTLAISADLGNSLICRTGKSLLVDRQCVMPAFAQLVNALNR